MYQSPVDCDSVPRLGTKSQTAWKVSSFAVPSPPPSAPGPWREAIERNAALWEADRPARDTAHAALVAKLAEKRRERPEIAEPMDVTAELEMLRAMTAPMVYEREEDD